MKFALIYLSLCLPIQLVSQLNSEDKERDQFFSMYVGISSNAAYRGSNSTSSLFLNESFSPGGELGFRYSKRIIGRFSGSVALGSSYASMRGYLVTDSFLSSSFEVAQQIIGFAEGGLCFRSRMMSNAFRFFVGYRINMPLPSTFGYGETDSEYMFNVETTVNPEEELINSLVIRPEFIVNSRKSNGKFSIGLQAVLGSSRDLAKGSAEYKSHSVIVSNTSVGNLANVAILGQIQF